MVVAEHVCAASATSTAHVPNIVNADHAQSAVTTNAEDVCLPITTDITQHVEVMPSVSQSAEHDPNPFCQSVWSEDVLDRAVSDDPCRTSPGSVDGICLPSPTADNDNINNKTHPRQLTHHSPTKLRQSPDNT